MLLGRSVRQPLTHRDQCERWRRAGLEIDPSNFDVLEVSDKLYAVRDVGEDALETLSSIDTVYTKEPSGACVVTQYRKEVAAR